MTQICCDASRVPSTVLKTKRVHSMQQIDLDSESKGQCTMSGTQ